MLRWRKVWAVLRFELESTLKRPGFLIATFGMPLFVLLWGAIAVVPAKLAASKEQRAKLYGVVDAAGILQLEGPTASDGLGLPPELSSVLDAGGGAVRSLPGFPGQRVFVPMADEGVALAALEQEEIVAYYLLREDYLATGQADVYFSHRASWKEEGARGALSSLLRGRLLADRVDQEVAERVRRPVVDSQSWTVDAQGLVIERSTASVVAGLVLPLILNVLLFVSVMVSAGYLLQGTAVEKENRVVEVLLAAANPDEILFGKLIGLGLAGLLQIAVWCSMVALVGVFAAAFIVALGIEIPWVALLAAPPFFVAGYFFIGSLILGTGALGKSLKEIQQYSMVWSFAAATPFFFLSVLITDPHGTIAKVLTWIPFSTPMVVVLRLSMESEGIAWWEVAGSFLTLLVATWLGLRLGARLFRVGLLLGGSRPKLREILRQARLSG